MTDRLFMTRDKINGELSDVVDIWCTHPARAVNDEPGDTLWVSADLGETLITESLASLTVFTARSMIGVIPDDDRQMISFPRSMFNG